MWAVEARLPVKKHLNPNSGKIKCGGVSSSEVSGVAERSIYGRVCVCVYVVGGWVGCVCVVWGKEGRGGD